MHNFGSATPANLRRKLDTLMNKIADRIFFNPLTSCRGLSERLTRYLVTKGTYRAERDAAARLVRKLLSKNPASLKRKT